MDKIVNSNIRNLTAVKNKLSNCIILFVKKNYELQVFKKTQLVTRKKSGLLLVIKKLA